MAGADGSGHRREQLWRVAAAIALTVVIAMIVVALARLT